MRSRGLLRHFEYVVWDNITYPFPNFNNAAIEVWEWISNFQKSCGYVITYPSRD